MRGEQAAVPIAESGQIELALTDLIGSFGLDARSCDAIEIRGDDPIVRTRYRIGAGGIISHVAVGLAASELSLIRGAGPQRLTISAPAAVASLRGNHYLTIDGEKPQRPWDDMSGFYKVKGGRSIFLHCNFPNLRDRAATVLGVAAVRERVAGACLAWDGEALETAIHEAGGCAAFVRSPTEWDAHPHAAAVKAMPLIEIVRIGDAPPEPLPSGQRPLCGIRALDLTRVIAGPACARTLAEHGADVLKVSRPDLPHSGMLDLDTGVGKLSTYLDFRDAHQNERLKSLISSGDVFVQSYRPGALASHGYGPEDIAAMRPGIIVATLSAWGHEGPWRYRRGYDTVVQAVTGMAHMTGTGTEPAFLPVSALDYISGNLMAFGVMVALRRRVAVGGSWLVRISLATTQHWLTEMGLLPDEAVRDLPSDVSKQEVAAFMRIAAAPDGLIRYLGPVLSMSETPPGTERPPVPLGSHPPEWPNN